ncbi:MAG: PadR family transcriptional regulator [Candidatus Micrarchaeota archaeon]
MTGFHHQTILMHGMLPLFALAKCGEAPQSGKGVVASALAISSGRWKPSPGTIYPLLKSLAEGGLIRETKLEGRGKEIAYAITPRGRAFLEKKRKFIAHCMEDFIFATRPVLLKLLYGLKDDEVKKFSSETQWARAFVTQSAVMPPGEARENFLSTMRGMDGLLKEAHKQLARGGRK